MPGFTTQSRMNLYTAYIQTSNMQKPAKACNTLSQVGLDNTAHRLQFCVGHGRQQTLGQIAWVSSYPHPDASCDSSGRYTLDFGLDPSAQLLR